MKRNDLMVDDWVTLNGVDYKWQWTHHDFTAADFDNEIEPIPLTIEILEKNGWKAAKNGTGEFILWVEENGEQRFNPDLTITLDITGSWLKMNHGVFKGLYLDHVHVLQHALRLSGYNQLANNFKI